MASTQLSKARTALRDAEANLSLAERQVKYWQRRRRLSNRKRKSWGRINFMLAKRVRERGKARAALISAKNRVEIATPLPLRLKAYFQAASQIGVMESGRNNAGIPFTRYQRTNGAQGPEAWCGDFMAWCYRRAGSRAVDRRWAAVRLVSAVFGVKRTKSPLKGDLVRFTFDHIGMFVGWCNGSGKIVPRAAATHILTIEGNTGASGAVSDSRTGGDGVYRKVRAKSLVSDYLHISK